MAKSINTFKQNRGTMFLDRFDNEFLLKRFTIPGITLGKPPQDTPLRGTPHGGGALEFEELTVTFAVGEQFQNWRAMYEWLIDTSYDGYKSDSIYSDAHIIIRDDHNNQIGSIIFENCTIVSLGSVEVDHGIAEPDHIDTDVTFMYTDMKFDFSV